MQLDVTPIANPTTASGVIATGRRSLCGWSFCEHTGSAPAKFILRDGGDGSGVQLETFTLAANESTRELLGTEGLPLRSGSIYLEILSGSIEGQVTVA